MTRSRQFPPPPSPRGLWVAVLGPDGSGKSSVLESFDAEFLAGRFTGVEFVHRRPGIIRPEKIAIPDRPHYEKPPHGPLKSLGKLIVIYLDWILGYGLHIALWRRQGYLIVFDRNILVDYVVDPLRYRYGGSKWLANLALRLAPQPDKMIFLDAPVEMLMARKDDTPEEIMRELRAAYVAMAGELPKSVVIDASQPKEAVIRQVKQIIAGGGWAAVELPPHRFGAGR